MSERRVRVRVTGSVQGVFFREATRREAERRSVAGWVRNSGDGTVEAIFEGETAAVEEMVRFCRTGPERAAVEGCDVSEETPEGLTGFEVR